MKKLWERLFGTRKQQCNIHDVSESVCGWCGEKRLLNHNGSCKCCACLDDEQTVC